MDHQWHSAEPGNDNNAAGSDLLFFIVENTLDRYGAVWSCMPWALPHHRKSKFHAALAVLSHHVYTGMDRAVLRS